MSKHEFDEMPQEEVNAYMNLGVAIRSVHEAGASNACVIGILESVIEELRGPMAKQRLKHAKGFEIAKQYKH